VRSFTAEAVDESALRALIDTAIQAPSALNAQPWAFVVIDDRMMLRDYGERAQSSLPDARVARALQEPGARDL
jgi:nitroreductase